MEYKDKGVNKGSSPILYYSDLRELTDSNWLTDIALKGG